jgi:hypothetical protein
MTSIGQDREGDPGQSSPNTGAILKKESAFYFSKNMR